MPSQSCGERTGNSTERVLAASRSRTPPSAPGRRRPPPPVRAVGVAGDHLHERGERLVQPDAVPPAHRDEVAEPHVGELVGDDVGDALLLVLVAVAGSTSRAFSRNVMQPRFSIAPAAKSGSASRSTLSPRVRDAVVALEPAQAERADVEAEAGQVPLPGTCTTRSGMPSTSTGSVASSGPTTNATRYVLITIVSANCTATLPPEALGALDLGTIGDGREASVDDERDAEDGLEVRLVPARERPPAVGGLHLGRGDDLLGASGIAERAAVEAAQLVVEDPGEGR